MEKNRIQVGICIMRDPKTGEPIRGSEKPIYRETEEQRNPATGLFPSEEKVLDDVAKVFADAFKRYQSELKKIKKE